jgi:uncharacterized membrane protein
MHIYIMYLERMEVSSQKISSFEVHVVVKSRKEISTTLRRSSLSKIFSKIFF